MTSETAAPSEVLTQEEANELVLENQGWAESIARAVARAWNLDWRSDGLDGAAMEALIFCSRRFKKNLGVPFKGYARKRIHEAATEAAKKTKGWRKASQSKLQQQSREISNELINIFPELREAHLPEGDSEGGSEGGGEDVRGSLRQLLVGAALIASRQQEDAMLQDDILDVKKMVGILATLEPIHQVLMWKIYWDGLSLRTLAAEWATDGLNVIREHKTIVDYLFKSLSLSKQFLSKPKVRPGLRAKALEFKNEAARGPFALFVEDNARRKV